MPVARTGPPKTSDRRRRRSAFAGVVGLVIGLVVVVVLVDLTVDGPRANERQALLSPVTSTPTTPTTSPMEEPTPAAAASTATIPAPALPRTLLDELIVAAAYSATPYRRDAFGSGWIDADHNCHNTRAEVLIVESLDPVTFNANGCTVATGRWVDPWNGFTSTKAADFEIDHTVALADAWRSGASAWTAAQREAFAQNLDDPGQLNALQSADNTSKSDKTADLWKPPLHSSWCAYATTWVRVKATWHLTVTPAEHGALASMLTTCGP